MFPPPIKIAEHPLIASTGSDASWILSTPKPMVNNMTFGLENEL